MLNWLRYQKTSINPVFQRYLALQVEGLAMLRDDTIINLLVISLFPTAAAIKIARDRTARCLFTTFVLWPNGALWRPKIRGPAVGGNKESTMVSIKVPTHIPIRLLYRPSSILHRFGAMPIFYRRTDGQTNNVLVTIVETLFIVFCFPKCGQLV